MEQNGLFPVSLSRHGDRYWRRFTSYRFAAEAQDYPITANEVLPAAASFPVVFRNRRDQFEPVILLSLQPGQRTPFVSDDGRWLGFHIPTGMRCYPFLAGNGYDSSERSLLMVNEASGLVTDDPADEPFFVDGEQLTPDLCAVRAFLQSRLAGVSETRQLCRKIANQDLFVPIKHHNGIPMPEGVFGIEAGRLLRLSQNQIATLMNSGALKLIHAHQVSMSHCGWLHRVQHQTPVSAKISESAGALIEAMGRETYPDSTSEAIYVSG